MWPFSRIIVASDGPFFYLKEFSEEFQEYLDRILQGNHEWRVWVQLPIKVGKIPIFSFFFAYFKALYRTMLYSFSKTRSDLGSAYVVLVFERNVGEGRFESVVAHIDVKGKRQTAFLLKDIRRMLFRIDIMLNPTYYLSQTADDGLAGEEIQNYLKDVTDVEESMNRSTSPEERSEVSNLEQEVRNALRTMRDANPAFALLVLDDIRTKRIDTATRIKCKFMRLQEELRTEQERAQEELEEVAEGFALLEPSNEPPETIETDAAGDSLSGGEVATHPYDQEDVIPVEEVEDTEADGGIIPIEQVEDTERE